MTGEDPRTRHIEVLRTARVELLGGDRAPEFWYVLHGYRQLARRFISRFSGVSGPERKVVAPEGLSRFYLDPAERPHGAEDRVGASWMTREDREEEIHDYLRYLDRVAREVEPRAPEGGAPRRTVIGFSQGAHTASRWAVLGSVRPDRLVLWGSGLPADLPAGAAARLRALELILVRGESDTLRNREAEAREEVWLEAEGIPHRVLSHAGGHRIDGGILRTLAG